MMSRHNDQYTRDHKPVNKSKTQTQSMTLAHHALVIVVCLLMSSLLSPLLPVTHAQNQISFDAGSGSPVDPGSTQITGSSFTLHNGDFTFALEFNDFNFEDTWMSLLDIFSIEVFAIFNDTLLSTPPTNQFFWLEGREGNTQLSASWLPGSGFFSPSAQVWDGVEWQFIDIDGRHRVEGNTLFLEGNTWGDVGDLEFFGAGVLESTANGVSSTRFDTFGWDPNQGLPSLSITISPKEPSTLDLSVTPMLVFVSDTLRVTAAIDPPRSGVPVQFTLYTPNGTIFTVEVTTDENGTATYQRRFQSSSDLGLWSMDASWDGDAEYNSAESGPSQFTVEKPQLEIQIDPLPGGATTIVQGENNVFTGAISSARGNVPIDLYYNGPNDQTRTFTVTTDEDGTFRHDHALLTLDSGSWTVHAVVDGTPQYFGAKSDMMNFTVTGSAPIPGFPYESIFLGLLIGGLILWFLQRQTNPLNSYPS
jgi:hypothetical protein